MGEIADALRRARDRVAPELNPPGPAAAMAIEQLAAPMREDELESAEALPETSKRETVQLRNAMASIALHEGPRVEACRRIALRVKAQMETARARSVAIVSAGRADGKTTVACNLALALASLSQGRRVALVDLDLRNPSVAEALGLAPSPGIEEALQGAKPASEVQVSIREPELDVYPSFVPPPRSHELLVLPRLAQLIDQLERRYEVVVIDTPPVLLTPDASLVLRHVGTCIPIARAGWTRMRSFRALIEALPRQAMLEGLLNGGRAPGHYGDDDYYTRAQAPGDAPKSMDWSTLRERWNRHGR